MKIIDARTGQEVRLGVPVRVAIETVVDGEFAIEDASYVLVYKGPSSLFGISATLQSLETGEFWAADLPIRYMYPGYPFQRVALVEI